MVIISATQLVDRVPQSLLKRNKDTNSETFEATQMVIGAGYEDAAAHQPDNEIDTQELRYSERYVDRVDMVVRPREEMTWETWRYALLGIGKFMQNWEYVELSFDIVVLGLGRVGIGRLFREGGTGLDR
ncbi:hypothetical protein HO133_006241 [Letharia lupina]|uniref:Uncharacterized protein n=1 Tax=Letharia lupina TaxID=560253 RepID=A0A8H6C6A5_9LECA|nr:uncharacterized protein HO133_006241 [Letharia lupina]KAF6217830.1 hypothetical protein HO133_006241 [Letharia lupina]